MKVVREEVEEASPTQKGGKSPGDDNIPAKLLIHGDRNIIKGPHYTMPGDLEKQRNDPKNGLNPW